MGDNLGDGVSENGVCIRVGWGLGSDNFGFWLFVLDTLCWLAVLWEILVLGNCVPGCGFGYCIASFRDITLVWFGLELLDLYRYC